MRVSRTISRPEAQRIALAAQGFPRRTPTRVDAGHVRRTVDRLGLVQLDSVNVLARAHYIPLFARLGPYDRTLLDRIAYRDRRLFEYWAHEASLIPVEQQPLFRFKMAAAARGELWRGVARFAREKGAFVASVLDEVADRGPLSAGELSAPGRKRGPWWGWADGKRALEYLFWTGQVAVAGRRNFERVYDLPERVLPPAVVAAPTPPEDDARRALLLLAARALGVATAGDLADYHRQRVGVVRPLVHDLVAAGELEEVTVDGWREPAYVHPAAARPRRMAARALVSPFDSLVWERARVERLFGFRYRIEIYVPAEKRVHGYYVLPFVLGDRLVARVDLKADRAAGRLLVRGAFAEDDVDVPAVAAALADELGLVASWLELDTVTVDDRGDLARPLRRAAGTGRVPSLV